MKRSLIAAVALVALSSPSLAQVAIPRAVDDRLQIELFAQEPQLVTPTGIDVDHAGRVWAVESNTHFPPDNYQGHSSDRILVFEDTTADHKADKITVFADGFTHTMSVAVRPVWLDVSGPWSVVSGKDQKSTDNGPRTTDKSANELFVATRREIFLLRDTDGDLKADEKHSLIKLDTAGNYPHNGLAGFAFDALGWMYFGFGENLGADYKIIGSDGVTLAGGGEGGNVYRCRPDGSKLEQWATGFWNPHASCVDAFGRLFTVDNDPDSRPPCRLLHIIPGGDYGFKFRNGRKGLHPFTAWNGEIPGTLPMVAGTGEAPSGIVAYESDGFPEDYLGDLLVGSWGDHRIDRFRLKPKGASFESLAETIIQGDEDFRPVGLAVAPDGSLFITDWVKRDYKLHGHGRIWRISAKAETEPGSANPRPAEKTSQPSSTPKVLDAATINGKMPVEKLTELLESKRLDVRRMAASALEKKSQQLLVEVLGNREASARAQVEAIWAFARRPADRVDHDLFLPVITGRYQKTGGRKIVKRHVETFIAALNVLGTPQFSIQGRYYNDNTARDPFGLLQETVTPPEWAEAIRENPSFDSPIVAASYRPGLQMHHSRRELTGDLNFISFVLGPFQFDDPFLRAIVVHSWTNVRSEKLKDYLSEMRKALKQLSTSTEYLQEQRDEISQEKDADKRLGKQKMFDMGMRLHVTMALAMRRLHPHDTELIQSLLKSPLTDIRRIAVQWVAEENLQDLRPQVEAILSDAKKPMTTDLFLATLAALEMLDGKDPQDFDKTPAGKYVLPLVTDAKRSPAVRAQALRLADLNDPALTADVYRDLLAVDDAALKRETVRALTHATGKQIGGLLLPIAEDDKADPTLRADAVAALTGRWFDDDKSLEVGEAMQKLAVSGEPAIQTEALRSSGNLLTKTATGRPTRLKILRQLQAAVEKDPNALSPTGSHRAVAEELAFMLTDAGIALSEILQPVQSQRPTTITDWYAAAKPPAGDADAGRRVFYQAQGAGCYKCHTVNGRGGNVGPDLSTIARSRNRERLAESILEPSKEIAPQFTAWSFVMESGQVHTGMILGDTRDGVQKIGTPEGQILELKTAEIELRTPQQKSLMPEKLEDRLTVSEFRDLLAFLETLK